MKWITVTSNTIGDIMRGTVIKFPDGKLGVVMNRADHEGDIPYEHLEVADHGGGYMWNFTHKHYIPGMMYLADINLFSIIKEVFEE